MIRVVPVTIEGLELKLASMTWGQAEAHVAEGKRLLALRAENGNAVDPDTFINRTLQTVADSLRRGGDPDMTIEKVKAEFDMYTIERIFEKVLEISSLRIPEGEAAAATE